MTIPTCATLIGPLPIVRHYLPEEGRSRIFRARKTEPAVAELLRPFAYVRRDATVPVAVEEMYVGS